MHLMTSPELAFYAKKIADLDEPAFIAEVEDVAAKAAWEVNHSRYDQQIQACYTEAARRDAVHLYNRGYNRYLASTGQKLAANDVDGSDARKAA